MPFEDELTAVYERGIKPVLELIGYDVHRADDLGTHQSIIRDIVVNIETAPLVVADLTNRNPNVMYEVGIAHARSRPAILLTQAIDDIPFDLRSYRAIRYDPSALDFAELRDLATRHLRGEVLFGNPVSDFVDIRKLPPLSREDIRKAQDAAVSAGRSLIASMAELGKREASFVESVPPLIEGTLKGDVVVTRRLAVELRRFASEQEVNVRTFRHDSVAYYEAVRKLVEGSDLTRSENADSARRLMESVRDSGRRAASLIDGLKRRREEVIAMADDLHKVSGDAREVLRIYDEAFAAVVISDASAQSLVGVIAERLAAVGA